MEVNHRHKPQRKCVIQKIQTMHAKRTLSFTFGKISNFLLRKPHDFGKRYVLEQRLNFLGRQPKERGFSFFFFFGYFNFNFIKMVILWWEKHEEATTLQHFFFERKKVSKLLERTFPRLKIKPFRKRGFLKNIL